MARKAALGLEKLLARIQHVQEFLNYRRAQINHYLSWVANHEAKIPSAPAIKEEPPRGTEMGNVVVKRAMVEAEGLLRYALMQLHDIERNQVWNQVNHLVDVATGCVIREIDQGFGIWIRQRAEEEKLREIFEETLDPDAVWLKAKKKRLEALQTKLEAVKWQKSMEEHERAVWELFEVAADMGINIGQRQTLMTEYFDPVPRADENA